MNDLISRQAAIDAVQQHREGVLGGYEYDEGVAFVYAAAHNHIIDVIRKLPSADPEQKKGRWITDEYGVRKCSVCDSHYQDVGYGFNFCPNCGTSMTEERTDE